MLSAKYAVMALGVIFIALIFNAAYAQWSPGGTMVYMGDMNLVSGGKAVQALSGSPTQAATNNLSLNNSSINVSAMDNSTAMILDLSSYARDRTNKNLAGYKNIMYPISGSRGTTTSTSGGGGGCGCS